MSGPKLRKPTTRIGRKIATIQSVVAACYEDAPSGRGARRLLASELVKARLERQAEAHGHFPNAHPAPRAERRITEVRGRGAYKRARAALRNAGRKAVQP